MINDTPELGAPRESSAFLLEDRVERGIGWLPSDVTVYLHCVPSLFPTMKGGEVAAQRNKPKGQGQQAPI
jgi:hypothetical protein